jgi:hypothetical protein
MIINYTIVGENGTVTNKTCTIPDSIAVQLGIAGMSCNVATVESHPFKGVQGSRLGEKSYLYDEHRLLFAKDDGTFVTVHVLPDITKN